jgi:MoaA/NifB/PqqE/SkfB family radical SAM enzyme
LPQSARPSSWDRLVTSTDPGVWSAEYVALAARIRAEHGPALRARGAGAPTILELHPGLSCPASCGFCPTQGRKTYPRARAREPLSTDEIRAIIGQFAQLGGRLLVLSGGLEPLAGPALPAAEWARAHGLSVHLYTSGLAPLLDDPERRARLVDAVDRVRFSLNGMSAPVYRDVQLGGRRSGELARVLGRIEQVARTRTERRAIVEIGLSLVAGPRNLSDLDPALDRARALALDFFDVLLDIEGDGSAEPGLARSLARVRERAAAGAFAPLRVRVSGRTGVAPMLAPLCAAPRAKVAVDPFGRVWRCCHVANPEIGGELAEIGDLRAGDLASVLSAERLAPRRMGCATCPDFERTFNALASDGDRGVMAIPE